MARTIGVLGVFLILISGTPGTGVAAEDSTGGDAVGVPSGGPDAESSPVTDPVWDTLARCESNQRWHIASGNGFYGGLQFDRQTWTAYGGGVYATRADYASREEQIEIAERLRAARGFLPWPACARRLGLR